MGAALTYRSTDYARLAPRPLSCVCLPVLLAMVALSGCLARTTFRDPPCRTCGRAAAPTLASTPRHGTLLGPPRPRPGPRLHPRPHLHCQSLRPRPTFVHALPSPTSSLTMSGAYDNRVEHAEGRYALATVRCAGRGQLFHFPFPRTVLGTGSGSSPVHCPGAVPAAVSRPPHRGRRPGARRRHSGPGPPRTAALPAAGGSRRWLCTMWTMFKWRAKTSRPTA